MAVTGPLLVHGGTDAGPPIRIDFSSNAHPLGPNPAVIAAVERADRKSYPDPTYTSLRSELGAFHGVEADRIVVGGSASELIWRLTHSWAAMGSGAILTDDRTFVEYLRAARALDIPAAADRSVWPTQTPVLHWYCNPDNPSGESKDQAIATALDRVTTGAAPFDLIVVDLAYWPFRSLLRADTEPSVCLRASWADQVGQLWSPNKLHGLTGVRGAYLVLPSNPHPRVAVDQLTTLAPSWVLGADGIALLEAHVRPESCDFLRDTAPTLRAWKRSQECRLQEAGWQAEPSPMHYGLWRPAVHLPRQAVWHARLRAEGIKLRDAASFGRPGWVRLVSRSPEDVQQLLALTEPFQEHL
jgi:histidinol-phosphate aminotransferase